MNLSSFSWVHPLISINIFCQWGTPLGIASIANLELRVGGGGMQAMFDQALANNMGAHSLSHHFWGKTIANRYFLLQSTKHNLFLSRTEFSRPT